MDTNGGAIPEVFNKDAAYLQQCVDVLSRLADCKSVLDNPTGHPWRGCKLTTFSQEAKDGALVRRQSDTIAIGGFFEKRGLDGKRFVDVARQDLRMDIARSADRGDNFANLSQGRGGTLNRIVESLNR